MKKTVVSILLVLAFAATLLAGCGGAASSASAGTAPAAEPVKLVVGATPAPHAEMLELVAPALAEQGIELEITVFNDYIIPNSALSDGSLDANFFQHLPYLDEYNAENGTNLVSAGGIHIEPLGVYPGRGASLDELADGAVIGIPNDTSNEARALALLQTLGYITIDPAAGLAAVPGDITDNPHNLEFVELEAAQLPVTLPDLDFGIINGNYAVEAGLGDKVLAAEGAETPYVNAVVVRSGDESRPEIQALVAALQSEEVRNFMEENYGGIVVPVF